MNRNPSMAGIASLVQSRGRDGDTMLVHMAPEEVKGLQSLALAAGGSLSINPDTGLYEANFLKKLLPTLLGFGLNFLFPGLGALGSGLLVGAGETIRTGGDLGKGLMAGLGAFGGAGLGAGLSSAANAASTAGATGAAGAAGTTAGNLTAEQIAAKAIKDAGTFGFDKVAPQAAKAVTNAATTAVPEAAKQGMFALNPNMGGTFANYGAGIRNLATPAGRTAFMSAIPGGQVGAAAGIMGLANAFSPDMEVPGGGYDIDDSYYESYGYSPEQGRFLGGQWRKGYPGFPGYAMGGPVMPRTNFNYPQAGITKSNYAPSLEYAKPREILDGYDTKVDPFTGAEGFADGGSVQQPVNVIDRAAPVSDQTLLAPTMPSQMEQYYQSLLTPPQQTAADPKFAEYLQNLNKFVTSPVAPPPPPPQPPQTPPANPPGDPRVTGTGGTGTGMVYDPTTGRFVPGTGSVGDTGMDLSELQNLVNSGMFSGFNFGELGSYLQNGGYGDTSGLSWDPTTGSFRQPGSQTVDTPPGTQNQFDMNNYQYNPFVDGFDMSSLPGYGQDTTQGLSPVTDIFAPGGPGSPVSPLNYGDMSLISTAPNQGQMQGMDPNAFHLAQMGDMAPYGTQFQGFQPQSTDFGSMYQAPAMDTPIFNAQPYSPQQADLGSMGDYGLGALSTTYTPTPFAMPSLDFTSQTPAVPTTSYSAPMTTGAGSTGVSAPQYGFGNSDVMYGNSMLGGDDQNIFGFAGGGAIQKAAAGKLVTGDGDGMSDDIRANINGDQEARLADGEFVIPADVVSHLGNGSTDAGADRLYSMMDRIRKARTGRTKQAPEIDAEKYLPA